MKSGTVSSSSLIALVHRWIERENRLYVVYILIFRHKKYARSVPQKHVIGAPSNCIHDKISILSRLTYSMAHLLVIETTILKLLIILR